jgi:hypothetical protein
LVLQIQKSLEPFNYEPAPSKDNITRISKDKQLLENGAEYTGEWDNQGRKSGRGV